jgi:PE family
MITLSRNLSLKLAAAAALIVLTAPASSDELGVNVDAAQQQRAQTYEAFKLGVENDHDRFATKVIPQQEPEQTKKITK